MKNNAKAKTKYVILKVIISLLIVISLIVALFFVAKTFEEKVETAKNNPEIINNEPEPKEPEILSPEQIRLNAIEDIKNAILKYYKVAEFAEIGYADPYNILSELISVEPTNPETFNDEYTLHFIAHPYATEISKAQLHEAAKNVMIASKDVIPAPAGFLAVSEVYNFQTNQVSNVYYSEHFSADELK